LIDDVCRELHLLPGRGNVKHRPCERQTTYLNAMERMRERTALASGLNQHESPLRTPMSCNIPPERKIKCVTLDGLELLHTSIVGYTDNWNLEQRRRFSSLPIGRQRTFVFLISAFKAPTPPRSPADMPSTSSMMRHVLSVMVTPSAFVAWRASRSASSPQRTTTTHYIPRSHPSNRPRTDY